MKFSDIFPVGVIIPNSVTLQQLHPDVQQAISNSARLLVPGSDAWLIYYGNPDKLYISGTIVRNSDNAVTAASVIWPDGTTGSYVSTVLSTDFPGAIDAYTITYEGAPVRTITWQGAVRNADGALTNSGTITVS